MCSPSHAKTLTYGFKIVFTNNKRALIEWSKLVLVYVCRVNNIIVALNMRVSTVPNTCIVIYFTAGCTSHCLHAWIAFWYSCFDVHNTTQRTPPNSFRFCILIGQLIENTTKCLQDHTALFMDIWFTKIFRPDSGAHMCTNISLYVCVGFIQIAIILNEF